MELKGRVALITGSCGEGMGRSTALRLAREGANIVLNYGTHRRGQEIQAYANRIAEAIRGFGGRAIVQQADTANEQQAKAMVEAALKEFGKVDILVNNVGGDWDIRDYTAISFEHWKAVLSAEVDSVFLMMKYIVPGMREHRWGRIVHIGLDSVLQLGNTKGVAPDYCLGKAARAWMTTAFGVQELSKGITVNCIEPGPTAHMTFEDALKAAGGDYSIWRQRERVTCHDVAEIIAFLCSEAGRFVSGSTIRLPMF
jgi:NAD(P)-dependent dehydrogenase (short-subunit alcohol dehydrogenase family)